MKLYDITIQKKLDLGLVNVVFQYHQKFNMAHGDMKL